MYTAHVLKSTSIIIVYCSYMTWLDKKSTCWFLNTYLLAHSWKAAANFTNKKNSPVIEQILKSSNSIITDEPLLQNIGLLIDNIPFVLLWCHQKYLTIYSIYHNKRNWCAKVEDIDLLGSPVTIEVIRLCKIDFKINDGDWLQR